MLVRLVFLLVFSAGTARAGTIDGHEWPPDARRYDAPGLEIAPGLAVGDTLDDKNAQAAKDLLPPEILKHYEKGEYRNEIGSWPTGIIYRDTYQVAGYLNHPATREGQKEIEWPWSTQEAWQCAEAVKLDRARLAGLRQDPDEPFDRRVAHPIAQLFDIQSLSRFGK